MKSGPFHESSHSKSMMRAHNLIEVGYGLHRPECVLAHSSGLIFTSNWNNTGGISVVSPSGKTTGLVGNNTAHQIRPNGIALEPGGTFLLAHLGEFDGGIYRLYPDGNIQCVISSANGVPLPPSNYVTLDTLGRIWITVSTSKQPRALDYKATACSGFIAVAEPGQSDARIVADNLGYTNECVIDFDHSKLYVNETFTRRVSVFDIADNASLSNQRTVCSLSTGTYPDGLALDEQGNLWISSIVSNRILKVSPEGESTLILEDADASFVACAEIAYLNGKMNSTHLSSTGNTQLSNTSSLAFGGSDLSIAYLGNLLGDCIHQFETGVHGKPPVHWDFPLGDLARYLDED